MSFCRITGKSRGLPKPNYFPLLPPISPADAKRLCRITNKSQGLPSHHYIPALSGATAVRAHCKVTAKSEGQGPHHFPNVDGVCKPHAFIPGYRYVFPKFDEEQKHQKNLINLMSLKGGVGNSDARYVYLVEEKKTNLVIPAGLEAAVRDGEIRDVMLDNEGDTILIKMYQGPSVTVDVKDFIIEEGTVMWDGLGPSEAVLEQRAKEEKENEERKAKRLEAIKARKKVFEDKEKAFDEEEESEKAKREGAKKSKLRKESLKENHVGGFTSFNEKLFSSLTNEKNEPIFGHIVQTSASVTFFPGTSVVDLPEGKIIPGRMVQHKDGIKFVPGIMVDGSFIPGQMVVTNNGEEFVPGQVIETREGPKFVPGQVAETSSGPKFVPGQTIETENGPQFVPGQIIETKAGPTFIPGQIIVTDNQAKFVPGRVIDTAEGPRFVPGRVIETGDQVTFVSGQVVETPEGLKFIAPDLENSIDGAQEFSVQGFEVTPEELRLLRSTTGHATSDCIAAIDSGVLKQLSSAGMSIGRQISTELPKVEVRPLPVTSERLKLTGEHASKMAQVVVNLVRLAFKVFKDDESCTSNAKLQESVGVELMKAVEQNKDLEKYLRVIVASAVIACRHKQSVSEEALMVAVSVAIENTLGGAVEEVSPNKIVDILDRFLKTPENFNQIIIETINYLEMNETVKDRIEFATKSNSEPAKIIKKLSKTLDENVSKAFEEIFSKDQSLLNCVLEQLKNSSESFSENQAEETVQNAIISIVKEKSRQKLQEMLTCSENKTQAEVKDFQNLLYQSVGLAKALGMHKVAGTLLQVISDSKSHEILCNDATIMNVLQRLFVMRQMAEIKPEFAAALGKLINDPEGARNDPSMRELMRCSTALLVVPKKDLESSADIPLSLLMSSNTLAMEEYLGETKRPRILLILKSGLQAVVPREAARAVLTGQVPYAVVDEKGIKYFEPLHVFSTMKLPKYAARCFSMYCCPETYSFRRVVKNYKSSDENEISRRKGDLVEILSEGDSEQESKKLKLDLGGETLNLLDNPAAKHKLSIRPKKKHGDPRQRTISSSESHRCLIRTIEDEPRQGWVSSDVLQRESKDHEEDELFDVRCKREAVVKELLETEEELGRDLVYVVDRYLKPASDGSTVPQTVRDNTDIIFSNFQQISNFHNTILLEGIKYYSNEPRMLGKTFLRLERDFDKHIAYCRDEPLAQEFLAENPQATEFFEELSQKLGDGKSISEYLKLPVQRINDYQVLIKDLVKYSEKLGENTYDLQRALELMLAIPQRANDNKFLSNIEGFHGNIHKLGRLLRHDWFTVVSDEKTSKERYLFLFKEHIIICKVKKISEDRSVFSLKDLIPLSEVKIRDCPDENTFEVLGKDLSENGCIKISGRKENTKSSWLSEIKKHVPGVFKIEEKVPEDVLLESKQIVKQIPIEQIDTPDPDKDTKIKSEKSSELENNILLKDSQEKFETMNRRLSTRKSFKSYEESYSMSSQREVYSQSSTTTSQFSATSVYDSRSMTSQNYESSTMSASTRAISGRVGSIGGGTKLSITSVEKPVFTRTITGLNLEPGDTAVFECQLESEAQLTWLKDNKALEDRLADRVVRSSSDDGTHRLELQHVIESDSGIYTAMAQNDDSYATCTAQLLVQKVSEEEKQRRMEANAPFFTVRLKDTELLTNTNFRFMVKVKGNPNPDVKFFKDGIPIRRGDDHIKLISEKADIGFYELVISDVQPNHAGMYSCKASNEFGEAHCEGTITVTDHKKVFDGLENEILLTPGDKPSFTWIKDGKPFDPDERFKVLLGNEDDSLALIFQHVKPEDAGLYTCVASTTTGKISCSAELSVQGSVVPLAKEPEQPKISSESKTCEATIGGSAMLEAKILGFPKPDIKWYHDGEEIKASGRFKFLYEDQETMTLVIKNVNPKDGGSYKIIAKNELGEDCTELSLTVKGAPKIIKKMEDVHVKVEEVIKITVGIEGSPTPDVKWYKDGKVIKESERVKIIKESEELYTLIIEGASATDSGSYSVTASNEVNKCTDFCQVKVHSAPKVKKTMEKNVEVSEGEDIVYKIEIDSESTPKVKWMKDGVEIKSDERKTKITVDGDVYTLTILNSDANDSAEYSVEISNEYGVTTDKGKATVKSKKCAPVFKTGLKDVVAKEGETDIEFSVQVNAYPKPKIRWYLGETEITEKRTEYSKVEDDNNYKLILKKVTTELKGTYTCKVENECGSAETSANLTVHSKPIFIKKLQPRVKVDEGDELTLQIECAGSPEPEISWFKDGQEIHTDAHIKITKDSHRTESYSMSLTLIKDSDGGEYEARATNCLGTATTQTYVEVISKVTETAQEEVISAVKQEPLESSQQAAITEEEGIQDRHTVEPTKTKISFAETEWGGVNVEEVDESYAEEKGNSQFLSHGIVEEYLDSEVSEHSTHKLRINRGVSIVSLSEDDKTLSRNNSAVDFENFDKNNLDDEEAEEISEQGKSYTPEIAERVSEKKKYSLQEVDEEVPEALNGEEAVYTKDKIEKVPGKGKSYIKEVAEEGSEGLKGEIPYSDDLVKKVPEKAKLYPEETVEKLPETLNGKETTYGKDTITNVPEKTPSYSEELPGKVPQKAENHTEETPQGNDNEADEDDFWSSIKSAKPETVGNNQLEEAKNGVIEKIPAGQKATELEEPSKEMNIIEKPISSVKRTETIDGVPQIPKQNGEIPAGKAVPKNENPSETLSEPRDKAEPESDGDEDPVVNALLSRIKKQRSVLEEILTKEAESRKEDTGLEQKPTFKEPLKDQSSSGTDVVAFKCVVAASPEPEVTWFHDGKEITIDGVKIATDTRVKEVDQNASEYTYTLKISKPEAADAGLYMIKANNKFGYGESSATLTIQVPAEDNRPEIKNLKDVTLIPNEDAVFEAEVISTLSVTVTWLDKNGEKIQASDRFELIEDKSRGIYKLKIKNAKIEDAGEYTLVASNSSGERSQGVKLFVHGERPTIVKPIEDTEVKDGKEVDFLIRCNGIPKPEVKWFKNGKELTEDERIRIETHTEGQVSSSLFFNKFQAEDEGEYKVVATNMVGSAENKFKLKLAQIAPVLEKGLPRSEEVDEGELLELKCKLNGSPIPQVAWLKDGVPLVPSDRVKVTQQPDGLLKLAIENMTPSDSGTYTLKAENPNGQITANCAVAVQPKNCKPKVLDGLKDAKAEVGQPLQLELKVMCFPAPEIKWFKDEKPVRPSQAVQSFNPDDGTLKLMIKSVKPEDAGLYSVKVSNKLGEVAQEAKVEVMKPQEKPKFEANMTPVSVVEGFPARFDVKATGNPKPIIKWFHNGKEVVPDGEHITVKEEPDGTVSLLLDKATPEDAGEYLAKAINDQGEASSKANLNVLGKKTEKEEEEPSFLRPLNNVAIEEDNKLILSAPIAGNPIPEVTWEKDGKPLKSDDRILLTCDGKKVNLEIQSCRPSDSGLYTCYLKNPLGEAKSKANVNVKKIYTEPVFVEKFGDTKEVQNKDVKLIARITGNPKPETEWFFNGEPIKEGDKYQIKCERDTYSLLIRNCKPGDSGLYRCSAFNRAGKAECVAQLDVVQKVETQQKAEAPSFLKKISDCDIYKGMTAKFTACCTGFPEPEFEWFFGDEKLRPSDRIKMENQENGLIRLTILGIGDEDVGNYRLRIFNPHGEAECSARLICDVLEPRPKKAMADREERRDKVQGGLPLPLSDKPIISRMTDRHLTLSWKPYIPLGPQLPVTYIVEMCKQPDGDWFTVRKGIRSCACDIRNLEPFQDYKFRVRVENKYGVSDPSPFAVTYRQKIIPDPPKFVPYLSPGIDFRPETSPYFPKDFDLDRPPHDKYEQAPKFLRQEHDVQYGIKNQNSNLFWFVYGYPKPTMTYYFNDEPIEMGGRYECSYTRNGQATLFINSMLDRDVGVYEAVARNEHGEARQRVRLEIAEYPKFIQRPEESYIMLRSTGQLTARIVGVPYPEIKWYKDWQPLAPSSRIKIQQIEPDTVILTIMDAILKDEGLYSVSATNVAGTVSSSAMVHIEEQEDAYKYATYGGGLNIKTRSEPLSNYYDIGDELGRGTQGITYHAVERRSGQNYAAKFMHGRSDLKTFMLNELNTMNSLNHRKLIRLHDSFETKDLLVLVMELGGGGELLEWLIKQTYITEYEIAEYIRQILWGLEYMHSNGYAHLSLTLNDLLLSRPDGDDIKICDFGLSRKIMHGNLLALNYGMPEFVAPEVANGEGVSYPADMWSLGIITYILLSGFSPFKGMNDRETLTRIQEGKWTFEDYFSNISAEAKDFITRLLAFKPEDRMDVKTALRHPWLERIGLSPPDQYKIKTDNLRSYHSSLKSWYKNANCRTWYRRQPLSNAFTHPSKMVYPPAHDYTPEPETISVKSTRQLNGRPVGDTAIPSREPLDYEVGNFKSESHYQYGPDTYLLQLRDVDLPCRLRHYMKVAANREQNYISEPPDKHIDWKTPVIRERRKFMDVMDEEIDDERRARISQYGSDDIYSLRRLKHEIGCRSDGHAEAEAMLEYKREGHLPFFREKPQNLAILQNQPAELSCLAVGDPEPVVQWFKNDLVMAESSRIKMRTDINKRYYLKFDPALQGDVGVYKVVARNKVGQTTARMRVVLATVPLSPDPPELVEASDTEILLKWKHECDDVFTPVLCYSLQYKESASGEWTNVCKNIDHEFWLVKNLQPGTSYVFRLSSKNVAGWSAPGIQSDVMKTKESGASKVNIPEIQRQLQSELESRGEMMVEEEPKPRLDYSVEDAPLEWVADSNLEAKYQFISEIFRGQFSTIVKGLDKSSNQQIVAKIFEVNANTEKSVAQEFDAIKSLRHEKIVTLLSAMRPAPNIAVFVMEKLQGADILSYFASRQEYNEDMLATVFTQVLDGLQYLHWRGFCHLDIQPDNVVVACVRSLQVKLVDFGSVLKVSKLGTVVNGPCTEFSAPEVINSEPAFPQTDIWSLGTLMYILLSGVSPFKSETMEETKQNITFVRYRFEHLYKEITQEATRFLMQIFKRTPNKRPTVEECYEARWLLSSEFMIKKRMKASFPGERLKEFSEAYHNEKSGKGLALGELTKAFGEKVLRRSNSVQEELITF